ncbi:carboxymuconolactone decarboxylase family protein [Tistrella mobilis]|jgi:alkyl hydroperoxide reductase subunit D|uniref:carboxymuconolactone decarboxylase family protein n=1 Tax=Tistrella mobilis TaxID=171437 RepID=UPI0031F72222
MSIEQLRGALPDYAKDLKLNLGNVLQSENLTAQQLWGTALASALAARNATVIKAIAADADAQLSPEAQKAARAAAAIMGMNNIYYRYTHLVSDKEYASMPAKLRMTVIGKPGVDHADFELWSLAVSAINGCGMCMDSHEKVVRDKGISRDGVQDAIRIASVVHAVAATFDAEEALAG